MPDPNIVNLTPSPRVLRMLGQIDFKVWQCLAELIDNSVDAFLSARGEAVGQLFPQANVELSSTADIRKGIGEIKVSDNGPGMAPEALENALRAGYSSNNPVDKLGLFGMGFNVATARLGNRTEVWTTRIEDDLWRGVRIDFDELERSGAFLVPTLTRRKTAAETNVHGTEVIVSKLDVERAMYLRSGGGFKSTRDKLSRVYNKIIRDIGLKVVVLGTPLEAREFCVWDAKREVETKTDAGRVPARIDIDVDLGERLYCDDCWSWLLENEEACPICGSAERLRSRQRKVLGWLGIQRYFDQQDYGIDLVRNGRVIEERSKVFFSWVNPETGESIPEYPVEQQHWGGRIVGELNVDFVPLASHQKDAFDKTSREWQLVEQVVRGDGPVIAIHRQRLGLPERAMSPLARLHQGYRRGNPAGFRWLVPGDEQGRGLNKEPQLWAAEFWAGNPDYQSDDRWWDAVKTAEEARNRGRGATVPDDLTGGSAFQPQAIDRVAEEPLPYPGAAPIVEAGPETREDSVLTGTYAIPEIPGSPTLDVSVVRLTSGSLRDHAHIEFAALGSRIEVRYDSNHAMFRRSLLEPVDCLVEELGYQLLARSASNQREWPLSRVTWELRRKYFPDSIETYDWVFENATSILNDLVEHYVEGLGAIAPLPADTLAPDDRSAVVRAVARLDRAGEERVQEVIKTGEFPRYLGTGCAEMLVVRWPELSLGGKFFSVSYDDVAIQLRTEVVSSVTGPLRDLMWVSNPDGFQNSGEEWRILLARAANSLRLLQTWRA